MAGSTVFWIGAGLVAAGFAIRFATLGLQSYHHDEVITVVRVIPGGFGNLLHEVSRSESTPPLYYILAWIWAKFFGLGEFGVRSLSAIFGVLTIPVAFLIGKELAGRRAGLLTMALVAFNPMMIWYSQEARAYALMILLCAVSLLFFLRFRRTGSHVDIALWWASSALALTSHYFAALPVAIEAGWLLVGYLRRPAVLAAVGGVAATGLALLPLASHQANPNHIDWIGHLALGNRIQDSGVSFLAGETGRVIGAVGPRERYALVPLILVAAILGLGALRGRRLEWRTAAIGLAIGLGSVALAFAAVAIGKDYILGRNLLPALLPLLAAIAVTATFVRVRRVGVALVAALCVYWLAFDVYVANTPALQRPDWKSVAQTLGPATRPRVIVTWALGVAPLEYYLNDDTERVKKGPFAVPEVDVVSKTSANKFADPLAAIFPNRQVHDLGRYTVTRYFARHPMHIGYRLLRKHVRTGFQNNSVMIAGGKKAALGSASAHRLGHPIRHRGLRYQLPAHAPGINRVRGRGFRQGVHPGRNHGQRAHGRAQR